MTGTQEQGLSVYYYYFANYCCYMSLTTARELSIRKKVSFYLDYCICRSNGFEVSMVPRTHDPVSSRRDDGKKKQQDLSLMSDER